MARTKQAVKETWMNHFLDFINRRYGDQAEAIADKITGILGRPEQMNAYNGPVTLENDKDNKFYNRLLLANYHNESPIDIINTWVEEKGAAWDENLSDNDRCKVQNQILDYTQEPISPKVISILDDYYQNLLCEKTQNKQTIINLLQNPTTENLYHFQRNSALFLDGNQKLVERIDSAIEERLEKYLSADNLTKKQLDTMLFPDTPQFRHIEKESPESELYLLSNSFVSPKAHKDFQERSVCKALESSNISNVALTHLASQVVLDKSMLGDFSNRHNIDLKATMQARLYEKPEQDRKEIIYVLNKIGDQYGKSSFVSNLFGLEQNEKQPEPKKEQNPKDALERINEAPPERVQAIYKDLQHIAERGEICLNDISYLNEQQLQTVLSKAYALTPEVSHEAAICLAASKMEYKDFIRLPENQQIEILGRSQVSDKLLTRVGAEEPQYLDKVLEHPNFDKKHVNDFPSLVNDMDMLHSVLLAQQKYFPKPTIDMPDKETLLDIAQNSSDKSQLEMASNSRSFEVIRCVAQNPHTDPMTLYQIADILYQNKESIKPEQREQITKSIIENPATDKNLVKIIPYDDKSRNLAMTVLSEKGNLEQAKQIERLEKKISDLEQTIISLTKEKVQNREPGIATTVESIADKYTQTVGIEHHLPFINNLREIEEMDEGMDLSVFSDLELCKLRESQIKDHTSTEDIDTEIEKRFCERLSNATTNREKDAVIQEVQNDYEQHADDPDANLYMYLYTQALNAAQQDVVREKTPSYETSPIEPEIIPEMEEIDYSPFDSMTFMEHDLEDLNEMAF